MSTVAQDVGGWRPAQADWMQRAHDRLAVLLYAVVQLSWFAFLALTLYWLF